MAETEKNGFVKQVAERKYAFGFTTDVQTEIIEKGLNEDIIRLISKKKNEPNGCWISVWKPINIGKNSNNPRGDICIFPR